MQTYTMIVERLLPDDTEERYYKFTVRASNPESAKRTAENHCNMHRIQWRRIEIEGVE